MSASRRRATRAVRIGRSLLAVLLAAALAAGCITSRDFRLFPAHTDLETSPAVLPVRWNAGLAIVETQIDGRGPCFLMLDTGASGLAIAPRVAEAFGLRRSEIGRGGIGVAGAQGTSARVHEAVAIRELRAGALVLRDVDALLLDVAGIEAASGLRIDGILPATAFHGLLLTFDPAEGNVTVARGELPPADGADVLALADDPLPIVTIDVGGSPCPVLLDSGSTEFLSVPSGHESVLRYSSGPTATGKWSTIGGVVSRVQARVDGTIAWGRHALTNPVISFTVADRGGAGGGLLSEFRTTFDMARGRVRFERDPAAPPIRTFPVRGMGAGFLRGPDGWTVAYLLEGLPAEAAGLREGDRIATFDGLPVSQIPVGIYDVMLLTQQSVRLGIVEADGTTRDVVVPVVTLVE